MFRTKTRWLLSSALAIIVVGGVMIWAILYLFSCHTSELAKAISPDEKWIAVVDQEVCNSTFDAPIRSVVLWQAGWFSHGHEVVQFDVGSFDDLLSVRWLRTDELEVTISDIAEKSSQKREQEFRGIKISYNTVPAAPWKSNH